MPLLRFLRLGEIFVDILNIDDGPQQVVIVTDALEPGGLGGETCRTMEVAYGFFDAGEFVHIIDGFMWVGSIGSTEKINVLQHGHSRGDRVERVEGFSAGGSIEDECVHIQISDVLLERDTPQVLVGTTPTFQDCFFGDYNFCSAAVVDIDLVTVAD